MLRPKSFRDTTVFGFVGSQNSIDFVFEPNVYCNLPAIKIRNLILLLSGRYKF